MQRFCRPLPLLSSFSPGPNIAQSWNKNKENRSKEQEFRRIFVGVDLCVYLFFEIVIGYQLTTLLPDLEFADHR
jgi:hypothetical protein